MLKKVNKYILFLLANFYPIRRKLYSFICFNNHLHFENLNSLLSSNSTSRFIKLFAYANYLYVIINIVVNKLILHTIYLVYFTL